MLIFSKIADLQGYLSPLKSKNQTIGFVPTMGALHKGHLSLITTSKEACNTTVCSIFVNPTQFNDPKDLERYPRTPEKDIEMLESAGCDVLFMPTVEEMYPNGSKKEIFDFGYLDRIMEGAHRPGHFSGVAQVVKRLFEITAPDKAFFGSKDYQQVMIVKALVKQMQSGIQIIACPIIRDKDGLAMSSRNVLLNDAERKTASLIPQLMEEANLLLQKSSIKDVKTFVNEKISKDPLMKLEYYEVCESGSLLPVDSLSEQKSCIALIACFVGRIRLIDNLRIN